MGPCGSAFIPPKTMFWTVENLPLSSPQISVKVHQFGLKDYFKIIITATEFFCKVAIQFIFFQTERNGRGHSPSEKLYLKSFLSPFSPPANFPSPAEAETHGGLCHEMPKSEIKPRVG